MSLIRPPIVPLLFGTQSRELQHASFVLSSYSAYGKYTPQYQCLAEELPKVNRSETPWLIVLMHSPWYNSNKYHYMVGETMRHYKNLYF
ncbi:purple acid phosphatase 2-like [Camellia sinensis]|uniref:purple acid phosphatase 2-like n=1 Tax=Camellia sinensis TaxID=4442 RepID=UPI00103615BF|nr:purple acid phosphatase 2-like [Camellia sinensis]